MTSIRQKETGSTFYKLQKLAAKLVRMQQEGRFYSIPRHKQLALVKRHDRYLNKIVKTGDPIAKAIGLFAVAMLFSLEMQAQIPCKQFINADSINPLKLQKLPFQIENPVFVDIDNDGDLDCYVSYPDSLYHVKFAFLTNTGTKKLPTFQLNATGGLPNTTTIDFSSNVEGIVFSDLDGDGDYDCFIGHYGGGYDNYIVYFENVGSKTSPSFVQRPKSANPLNFAKGAYGLYFNLVDIDADGDFDLYVYDLYDDDFYGNIGTKTSPQFVKLTHDEKFINPKNAHTTFVDWNKDGTIDYIKGDVKYPYLPDNVFYKNDGTISNPHFTKDAAHGPVFPPGFKLYSFVDLNNDGFLEAFSYKGVMATTSPVPKIKAVKTGQTYTLQAYPKGIYTYQWLRNKVKLVNETKDSLKVTQSGSYIVQVTGNCGTGISLPYKVTININAITSLPAEQDASALMNTTAQLQVYPNPFVNECVLKFNKEIASNVMIYITDVQGRIINSLHANNNEVRFGKDLAAGIYFIKIINGKEVIFRQKVVKQ